MERKAETVVRRHDRDAWDEIPYAIPKAFKKSFELRVSVPPETTTEEVRGWAGEFAKEIGGVTVTANPARKNAEEVTFKVVRNNLKKN